LVVTKDVIGGPYVQIGQTRAVRANRQKLVLQAPPTPLTPNAQESLFDSLSNRRGYPFARLGRKFPNGLLCQWIFDAQCHWVGLYKNSS
jgi:hypothetical protein